jgi:hypothetical protein
VTSAKHKHNFAVKQIEFREYYVDVLSVSSEGQLLVGCCYDCQLHVYSAEGNQVTSVNLLDGHTLTDAAWTPRGNIVYTAYNVGYVVLLTQQGTCISKSATPCPYQLSISTDGVIYLSNNGSVYQSTDDGVTWSHVFNVAHGWECWQAVKVSSDDNTQVFWTVDLLKEAGDYKWLMRSYTLDKWRDGSNATSHDIFLPSHATTINKLAYDGHTNVFVTDFESRAVHMWSVSGQYVRQLASYEQLLGGPLCVAVDSRRGHVMYVGQDDGIVSVFDLT